MSPSGVTWIWPCRVRTRPGRALAESVRREGLDEPAPLAAKPVHRPRRLDKPRLQARIGVVELGHEGLGAQRARTASRRSSSRSRPRAATRVRRIRCSRYAAVLPPKWSSTKAKLGREHSSGVELDLLLEHEPLEHGGCDVPIADRARERIDRGLPDLARRGAQTTPAPSCSSWPTVSEASSCRPAAPGRCRGGSRTQR